MGEGFSRSYSANSESVGTQAKVPNKSRRITPQACCTMTSKAQAALQAPLPLKTSFAKWDPATLSCLSIRVVGRFTTPHSLENRLCQTQIRLTKLASILSSTNSNNCATTPQIDNVFRDLRKTPSRGPLAYVSKQTHAT